VPTRRGWSLLGAVVGLFLGWRLLGLIQLLVLGVAAGALLALAIARVRTPRIVVEIGRSLPARLTVGAEGRGEIEIVNRSTRPLPECFATERFGRERIHLRIPSLLRNASARAGYAVPTSRRGRFVAGPLRVVLADPFGLAARSFAAGTTSEVLVCPRIVEILPPPELGGDDSDLDAHPLDQRADSGGEFLTLREYEIGDDLRRVHWRSTARTGTLMIRQHQSPRRSPAVVVLDVRPGAHRSDSFETAVEVAASVVAAFERAGRPADLLTTDGRVLGTSGRRHLDSVLDELAVIERGGGDAIAAGVGRRRAASVIAITGALHRGDPAAFAAVARARGSVVIVDCTRTPTGRAGTTSLAGGVAALVVGAGGGSWGPAWNEAVLRWHRHTTPRLRSPRSRA
jgi:uncharacterized protein (DUF58 family)